MGRHRSLAALGSLLLSAQAALAAGCTVGLPGTAASGFCIPYAVVIDPVTGLPLGTTSKPITVTPGTCAISAPTVVTGVSGLIIAQNPGRRSLRWMNIGGADVTVVPGTTPPAVGQGMIYNALAAGKGGGSETFADPAVATNAFSFSAASSAMIAVWECQ